MYLREDNRRRGHKRRKGERSKKSQLARALVTPRRTVACAPLPPRRCAGRARKTRDMNIFFSRFIPLAVAISLARGRRRRSSVVLSRLDSMVRRFDLSTGAALFDGSTVRSLRRFDLSSAWTRFDGSIFQFVRRFDDSLCFGRFDDSMFRYFNGSIFRPTSAGSMLRCFEHRAGRG